MMAKDKRTLFSCAMHPSGYYMAAGFHDKIRIMHILHDVLRDFKAIEIKCCKMMKFSNGGQFFACMDNKEIQIYGSYTLERLNTIKCSVQPPVSCLAFNEDDTQIVAVSKGGFFRVWDAVSGLGKAEEVFDKNCKYKSCSFLPLEHS